MNEQMNIEYGNMTDTSMDGEPLVASIVRGRAEADYIRIRTSKGWYWIRLSQDGSLVIETHEQTTIQELPGLSSYERPYHYLCEQHSDVG